MFYFPLKLFITASFTVFVLTGLNHTAYAQEKYPDKLYPRSAEWSVDCRILSLTEETVLVMFQRKEAPVEIHRTSLLKIEYGNGRQIHFNEFGQVSGEVTLARSALVEDVLNLGLIKLEGGEIVVLNGIDFSLPADSLEFRFFREGTDYVRNLILNQTVQLQIDLQRRDEFGRLLAYIILPGGLILNAEIIKQGYCRVDRGRLLIYLEDFKLLETEAHRENRGIWSRDSSFQ